MGLRFSVIARDPEGPVGAAWGEPLGLVIGLCSLPKPASRFFSDSGHFFWVTDLA